MFAMCAKMYGSPLCLPYACAAGAQGGKPSPPYAAKGI